MLLILNRTDLRKDAEDLPLSEIEIHHKRRSSMEIFKANMVLFYCNKSDGIKVLKNRFGETFTHFP